MFFIALLLAISVILTVVSLLGIVFFFFIKKDTKMGFVSVLSSIVFVILIFAVSYVYGSQAEGYTANHSRSIESVY